MKIKLHAVNEGRFTNDPYIINNQPQSILCVLIINQGELIGLLYLENNLSKSAFTFDRLKVLKLLSSQAGLLIKHQGCLKVHNRIYKSIFNSSWIELYL